MCSSSLLNNTITGYKVKETSNLGPRPEKPIELYEFERYCFSISCSFLLHFVGGIEVYNILVFLDINLFTGCSTNFVYAILQNKDWLCVCSSSAYGLQLVCSCPFCRKVILTIIIWLLKTLFYSSTICLIKMENGNEN